MMVNSPTGEKKLNSEVVICYYVNTLMPMKLLVMIRVMILNRRVMAKCLGS